MRDSNPSKEWNRALWKRPTHPDNYVPPEVFLASLQRNAHFRPYAYWPLVFLTCTITQHIAVVFIFVAVFVQLNQHLLDPRTLVSICLVSFVLLYALWTLLSPATSKEKGAKDTHSKAIKSSIMVFLSLVSLSPILRTLTATTTSDSIWALAAILFFLNTLLGDYTATDIGSETQGRLTSMLSMNAAISASVVLASRLETDLAVFALILFAVLAFVLYPIMKPRLQSLSAVLWSTVTLLLCCLAVWLLAPLSYTVAVICAVVVASITFVAPMLLIWAQRYKNNIRGPWDVATPKLR